MLVVTLTMKDRIFLLLFPVLTRIVEADALSQDIGTTDSCNATDSRGFAWYAEANTNQKQNCSAVDNNLSGEAEWFCVLSEIRAYFNSTEPDRSKCVSESLSTESSLIAVLNYTSDLDRALTGGEIEQIAVIVGETDVIENEMEDLVTIINHLLQSHISWSEIVGKE